MRKIINILPVLLAAFLLILAPAMTAHASFLPGKLMSIKEENEMGAKFDRIIRSQMGIVGDTYITDYVNNIVTRVNKAKKPMPFTVRSTVIASPMMNAFAIPGGYIYTFTGLIQNVESESQLAGVISHELAHVSQRHVAKRIEKQKAMNLISVAGTLAGMFLGAAGGNVDAAKAGTALMMGAQAGATTAMLNYSQDDEREADHVGLNALIKAGYNPRGMPETFNLLQKNKWFGKTSNMPSYLSTHPGLPERVEYLNDRIDRMPPQLKDRPDHSPTLPKVQALVRAKMSNAKAGLAYYSEKELLKGLEAIDYMAIGIINERLKRSGEARTAFMKAIELDNDEPLIAREYGIFNFKTGNYKEAFKFLQKAVIKNRRDALALFYLARLQAETKDYERAAGNMKKVMEIVPHDWEVHHHLGMIQGQSGDTFNGNLNLAYARFYRGDLKKARYYFGLAKEQAEPNNAEQEAKLDEFMERMSPGHKKAKEKAKKEEEK